MTRRLTVGRFINGRQFPQEFVAIAIALSLGIVLVQGVRFVRLRLELRRLEDRAEIAAIYDAAIVRWKLECADEFTAINIRFRNKIRAAAEDVKAAQDAIQQNADAHRGDRQRLVAAYEALEMLSKECDAKGIQIPEDVLKLIARR